MINNSFSCYIHEIVSTVASPIYFANKRLLGDHLAPWRFCSLFEKTPIKSNNVLNCWPIAGGKLHIGILIRDIDSTSDQKMCVQNV